MTATMPPQLPRDVHKPFSSIRTSELNVEREQVSSAVHSQQKACNSEVQRCQSTTNFQMRTEESKKVKSADSSFKAGETVDGNFPSYNEEVKRLESFTNWPAHSKIDYKKLAKAGFFYFNKGDEVMCFSCRGTLSGFQPGYHQVMKKHRELFPQCDFVNEKSNNVPLLETSRSNENRIETNHIENGSVENMRPENENHEVQTSCKQAESVSDTDKRFEKLQNLEERLKTYTSWPVSFLSPREMAEAGFFYCGSEDKVQCAFCRGGIFNWQHGNDPVEQHLKQFPCCPYFTKKLYKGPNKGRDVCGIYRNQELIQIRGQSTVGVTNSNHLHELGISLHRGPKHPEQATETARLRSFQAWPSYIPIQKELLAKAGFFYIGISDHTKCFYCGGGLRSWEPDDDPWIEHSRWFPNCAYLQLTKGKDFIENCRQKHSSETTNSANNLSSASYNGYSNEQATNPNVEKIMNSSMVQSVLESGPFPHSLVRAAVIKHERETGREFLNIDELSETVAILREEDMLSSSSENGNESSDDQLMTDDTQVFESGYSSCESNTAVTECETTDVLLKEEPVPEQVNNEKTKGRITIGTNGKVKDICLCKICMDNEVGIVFLPCGHLLACPTCAAAITDCPVCRTPIKGIVRTYLP